MPPKRPESRKMIKSQDYKNEGLLSQDLSVSLIMIKNGYSVIANVHSSSLMYIKAMNRESQIVYIHVDTDTYSYIGDTDMEVLPSGLEIVPDHQVKRAMKYIGNEVGGVAFECSKGVCVSKVGDDGVNVTTQQYVMANSQSNSNVHSNVYPLISLKDIKDDPKTVAVYVDRVTRRLRNGLVDDANIKFDHVWSTISDLTTSITEYSDRLDKLFDDIRGSIQKYEDELEAVGETTFENQIQKETLQKKLRHENDRVMKYVAALNKIGEYQNVLDDLIVNLDLKQLDI
jgi:hypothetical protein